MGRERGQKEERVRKTPGVTEEKSFGLTATAHKCQNWDYAQVGRTPKPVIFKSVTEEISERMELPDP